jgi:uncharacterized short protein YbdD (DUF466 family)
MMMYKRLRIFKQRIKQCLSLMIGLPDYPAYVKHCQIHHPDKPIMSYEVFFLERQRARYSNKKPGRCC